MITLKFVLRTDQKNKQGRSSLYLRITKTRKLNYIKTGFYLTESEWDEERQRIRSSYSNSVQANHRLNQMKYDIEKEFLDRSNRKLKTSSKLLKELYLNKDSDNFIDISKQWIEDRFRRLDISKNTFDKYNVILNKLKDCFGDHIRVDEINNDMIEEFEDYLIDQGNKYNTISSNLSYLRALINNMVKSGRIKYHENPFLNKSITYRDAERKYLERDQVRAIIQLELKENSLIEHCRDIFIFNVLTGLRIGDAIQLQVRDFDGSHIRYKVHKTKDFSRLKLNPLALEIIEKYIKGKSASDYIFDFLNERIGKKDFDRNEAIKSITALINKYLKKIAAKAKVDYNISTHWARHTFAFMALNNDVSYEELQAILNHSNIRTTQKYAKISDSSKDLAMGKIAKLY